MKEPDNSTETARIMAGGSASDAYHLERAGHFTARAQETANGGARHAYIGYAHNHLSALLIREDERKRGVRA